MGHSTVQFAASAAPVSPAKPGAHGVPVAPSTGSHRRRRGVAIVIVIMILAAMLAVIAPFVLSMTQTTKVSSSYLESSRAQYMCEAGVRLGRAWSYQFDPMWQQNAAPPFNNPDVTTLAMLDLQIGRGLNDAQKKIWAREGSQVLNGQPVGPLPPAADDPTVGFQNGQGCYLTVHITDEQSKLNINTVPCRVLGNLLGSCLATEEVTDQTTVISVDDASMFYDDGDPRTVDGYIAINGVRKAYLSAEGKQIVLAETFDQGTKFPINSLVYDGRAEMIREMRRTREFQSIYELREIGTRFGPQAVVRPQEFERILPFLTAHSFRPSKWSAGTRILDRGFSTDSYGITVEDPRGFDAQTHVAIFDSTAQGENIVGRPEGYIVLHNNQRYLPQQPLRYRIGFVDSLNFDLSVADADHYLWLRSEIPHPVNINTASFEVLKAMVKGCPAQGGYANGAVDEKAATAFAIAMRDARKAAPIDSYDKLFSTIDDIATANVISADFAQIIKQSMVADRQGMRCAALPVCFRSYFDYTVESNARYFDPSGNLRGQAGVIETFRVPARFPGLWYVDSQSQWRLQADLNGAGSGWLIGPRYIAYNGLNNAFYANVHPFFKDLLPDYTTVQQDNGQIFTEVEFNLPGAYDWAHLPFEMSAPDIDMMKGKRITGRINLQANGVNQLPAPPVLMSGWFFPTFSGQGSEIFFSGNDTLKVPRDTVRLTAENGLSVYVTDSTGEEYLTVFDGVKLTPRVWHHICITATGAQPGQVFMTLDGKPLGQFKWPTQYLSLAANLPDQFDPPGVDPTLANSNVQLAGDASALPDMGTIRVGDEIIEYGGKSGNTLKLCLRGRRFTSSVAHASGEVVTRLGFSVKLEQPYVGNLNGHLVGMKVGGADVGLPATNPACSINKPNPPNAVAEIDAGDTTIPIFNETADKMPDYGFAIIDYAQRTVGGITETRPAELIWYSSRDAKNLNNVQRGMQGTVAGKHWHNCRIYNAFVEATGLNGYTPPAGQKYVVQVDNKVNPETDVEWIEYSTIYTMNGHSYLAHAPSGSAWGNGALTPFQNWQWGMWERGVYDTGMATHVGNEKMILVRAVNKPWLGQAPYTWDPTYSQNPLLAPKKPTFVPGMYVDKDGTGNEVFLTEANNQDKFEKFYVKHAWSNHPWKDHRWNGSVWEQVYNGRYGGPYMVGLNDNPKYDYPTATSRVIRTPVPEFINSQFLYSGMAFDRQNDLNGYVDELTYGSRHEMVDGTVYTDNNFTPLASGATTIQIQDATAQQVPVTGLAMIGNEIVYFDNASRSQTPDQPQNPFPTLATPTAPPNDQQAKLDNLPQWNGAFQPSAITLSNVQRGMFGTVASDWPAGTRVRVITPIFASSNTGTGATSDISLKTARDLPPRGFVSSYDDSGQVMEVVGYLSHNNTSLGKSGTLRNRYGSGSLGGGGQVYLWQPVRHLDYYQPSLNQLGGAYFPLQHRMEGGLWEGLEIDLVDYESGVRARDIETVVLARFNEQPGWDAPITNQPGGLYRLTLQNGSNRIQFPNAPVRADQLEVRIMQTYLPGAITSNDWKLCQVIGRVRFLVHSEGQIYRRDKSE